jgi:hypothetical protein
MNFTVDLTDAVLRVCCRPVSFGLCRQNPCQLSKSLSRLWQFTPC